MENQLQPGIIKIPFNSPLHQRIIRNFKHMLTQSRNAQRSKREAAWKASEDTFMAYMPEREVDTLRKADRNGGIPQYTTIAIPYSYAMLLTSHTYYTSVFLNRTPVLQVQGRHGESQMAEMAMESLLEYQLTAGGGVVPLYVWLLDVGKYGHGVIGHYWDKEVISSTAQTDVPVTFLGVPIPGRTRKEFVTTTTNGYVGNRLYNIRPQDFYPDPRVPLYRFQEGEYCAVFDKVGWNKIRAGAISGRYYNVGLLQKGAGHQMIDRDLGSPRVELPNEVMEFNENLEDSQAPALVNLHEFYWTIIPAEFGFGSSRNPEKWVFTIANESIVVSCQPLGLAHNKYPFDVLQFEVDGYSLFTRGMMEILDPMNKTMEWLFNSHFYNVRAALNNMFAVDPSKVNMKDLEDPNPGKVIRLKPAGYGQDIRTMMQQFTVSDVTKSNMADLDTVGSFAQRILGVTDNVMGMVNPGGRKTATEVRTSSSFSVNRLKTNCEWFSAMGFSPLTQKMVCSTQQLMDFARQYRIVGDTALLGQRYISAGPAEIAGLFDFVPVDGSLPVDRFAQVNLWQNLMGQAAQVPQIAMQYDFGRIFAFVAQLGGLKNINQFRIQIVPDNQLLTQAQSGGMVPMAGESNPMEPGQIPGMGATG